MKLPIQRRVDIKHEIMPDKTIGVRVTTVTMRDGVDIAKENWRGAYVPGSDLETAPDETRALAGFLWTEEVIAAFEATQTEENP